jgi:hypothetical protein
MNWHGCAQKAKFIRPIPENFVNVIVLHFGVVLVNTSRSVESTLAI